jgi:hypothetical protein
MRLEDIAGRAAVAVSALCAAAVLLTAGVLFTPALRERIGLAPAAAYAAGAMIDVPRSVYAGSAHTVVLFARYDCRACQRATPYLAAVVAGAGRAPGTRIVMVARPGHRDAEIAYARQIGLHESSLMFVDVKGLRLRTVPTVVLVDQRGVVQYAFEGLPPPQAQGTVLKSVLERVATH